MKKSPQKRIFCAITHVNEITLELCKEKLREQRLEVPEPEVVSGLSPASAAFNRCCDLAYANGADILIHLAADVLLADFAIQALIERMHLDKHYAVTGRGFDIFNGENAPVGVWALNMAVIRDHFRFRDVFKMDLDFCERIESETGLARIKTKSNRQIAYHHPIWTPKEIYKKFRYNAQKYKASKIRAYLDFFDFALSVNPGNKVLQIGLLALKRGAAEPHMSGSPRVDLFEDEWQDIEDLFDLTGKEFFVYHRDFMDIAKKLLNSDQNIIPMAGVFFAREEDSSQEKKGTPLVGVARVVKGHIELIVRTGRTLGKEFARRVIILSPNSVKNLYRNKDLYLRMIRNFAMSHFPLQAPAPKTAQRTIPQRRGGFNGSLLESKVYPTLPYLAHGSVTEGVKLWEERWKHTPQHRRVLMVSPKDFAGSMYKWAESLNRYSEFAVRLIQFEFHQYDYPVDLVLPACGEHRLNQVLELADQAGIFHLKDEHTWFLRLPQHSNLGLIDILFFSDTFRSTPKVFTHYGGYARKFKDDEKYISTVKQFDGRIAMTPDLNFDWFGGHYIPHTIDVESIPYTWSDSHIIAHSPSSPEKKGTYLLEESVMVLQKRYPDIWRNWSLGIITGVSHEECFLRKRKASLFFDQAGRHRMADLGIEDIIGWYGNSAIEAMACGIPTIAHLSEIAFARAEKAGVFIRDAPVINIPRTREGLVHGILGFVRSSPEEKRDLSRSTRRFTVEFHGYENVGQRLAAVYKNLLSVQETRREDHLEVKSGG